MITSRLPDEERLYRALVERDPEFDGLFFFAVRTTGIFCRSTCPAKKPRRENVSFFPSTRDAIAAGYRPCKRCKPLVPSGTAPEWLVGLLDEVERDRSRRWQDDDLRALGLDPARVRRWFKREHGITFHAYQRARRLGLALGQLQLGSDLSDTGLAAGYESSSGFREAFEQLFGATPGRSRGEQLSFVTRIITPLGPMLAVAGDDGVSLLEFVDRRAILTQVEVLQKRIGGVFAPGEHELLRQLEAQLVEYFAGTRQHFDLPLQLRGTEFQESVWRGLLEIPHGETRSYAALAEHIGRPGSSRAVGRANGDNRLAILVPCHRVVRADGELSGYAGGLWRKRALLDHEREAAQAGA